MKPGEQNCAERRLAAILAADVAGYSRLIGADEAGTLDRLKSLRAELIDPTVAAHRGRIVKTTGDGLLVEFASVVDALRCATDWQRGMAERTAGVSPARRIEFRIGINVGDVVVEDGDIFGDGVNVAARLEALAEPGGICVSARVQEDAAGRLDLLFEDIGDQVLKNIARPVRVYRVDLGPRASGPHAGGTPALQPALALPDKPSIAVLPFQNMSGDPEQEYFADGMVEEIITALSRIRWLFVIARNSTFTYKGQPIDVKQVGRELGVRYVLEGSVRKGGNRVRITAQLIDALTGTHLWADRFDGLTEDVFSLQDEIAASVAGVLGSVLEAAEVRRSAGRPTTDLTAYDLYLQALPHWASCDRDRLLQALDLLGQAIDLEPDYAPALGVAAACCPLLDIAEIEDKAANRKRALNWARRAILGDSDDPAVLANAAGTLGYFGENIDTAIALIDRALTMNPNLASGWEWSGWIRQFAGQPDLSIEHFGIAMRLSPRDPWTPFVLVGIGIAHFFARRFDEAVTKLLAGLEEVPSFLLSHQTLAASYAHLGRLDEARQAIRRLRVMTPVIEPSLSAYRDPEHRELLLSGLRLAMGETA